MTNSETDSTSLANNVMFNGTLVTPAGIVMVYGPGVYSTLPAIYTHHYTPTIDYYTDQ